MWVFLQLEVAYQQALAGRQTIYKNTFRQMHFFFGKADVKRPHHVGIDKKTNFFRVGSMGFFAGPEFLVAGEIKDTHRLCVA